MKPCFIVLSLAIALLSASNSANANDYSLITGSFDQGGGRGTSSDYELIGSLSSSAGEVLQSADYTLYPHLPGQLYTPVEMQITAAPAAMAENGTKQLAATQVMDDDTTLPVPAAEVTWLVLSGPVTSISAAGVAQAGSVYENTAASVQGSASGVSGTLNLTVLDSIPDNFGHGAQWEQRRASSRSRWGRPLQFDGICARARSSAAKHPASLHDAQQW